jgi:inosine-uridine nucleoside N-ribohydrolase
LAETKSSGIFKKAKESAIVGGTFFCWGKVTPHAEFNIWFNAEAEERQYLIAEMILLKRAKVRVETKSELTRGQMSIDSRPVPQTGANARVALQVERGKFFTSFVEDLK